MICQYADEKKTKYLQICTYFVFSYSIKFFGKGSGKPFCKKVFPRNFISSITDPFLP